MTRSIMTHAVYVVPPHDSSSPMVLTTRELIEEADKLALRIAHSNLPARDVRVVQELAARLGSKV